MKDLELSLRYTELKDNGKDIVDVVFTDPLKPTVAFGIKSTEILHPGFPTVLLEEEAIKELIFYLQYYLDVHCVHNDLNGWINCKICG